MKKTAIYFLMMSFAASSVLTSCKKDKEDDDNDTQTTINPTDLFNYSDAYGVLIGINTVTYTNMMGMEIPNEIGTAAAIFPSAPGSSTLVDAGAVSVNTKALTKQTGNSYVLIPNQTDVTGVDFSAGSSWEVSGSSSVGAFAHTFSTFPSNPKITSSVNEVSLSSGYTFTLQNSNATADSVLFILASNGEYVSKTLAGGATTATFSASELATLKPSSYGLIQVTPYKIDSAIKNGNKYYFVNQVTVTNVTSFKN